MPHTLCLAPNPCCCQGWAPGSTVQRTNAPNGMEVGIDFPFVCETCLGPNPYVRMVKSPPGNKLCHVTGRPFQSFRWRAGPGGRWKECMVEASVAKDKNICQACLVDMTYGVPVGVRDALLQGGAASTDLLAPTSSDPNTAFYWQQKDALAATSHGAQTGGSIQNLEPSRQLLHLARSIQSQEHKQTTAWRNLPKLCSFWLGGTCTRVVQHKCPFRPCNGMFEFPELAAVRRRRARRATDQRGQHTSGEEGGRVFWCLRGGGGGGGVGGWGGACCFLPPPPPPPPPPP